MLNDLKLELEALLKTLPIREFDSALRGEHSTVFVRGRTLIDFTSWDALSLWNNRKIKKEAMREAELSGLGSSSPRAISGTSAAHLRAEQRIAKFLGLDSALLFSSKNQAVLSLVTGLIGERDTIWHDELVQSPIADAAYLVGAQVNSFSGSNLAALKSDLEKYPIERRKFIFVESLSPVTGMIVNFPALHLIAAQFGAHIIVDESRAIGSVGLRGAGICEEFSLNTNLAAVYGDLSLSVGGFGGFIAGTALLIKYLGSRSRTFVNESPLPSPIAAAIEAGLDWIELQNAARERLNLCSTRLRSALIKMPGVNLIDAASHIVCLHFSKLSRSDELAQALFQRGFLAESVPTPTLRTESGIVRFVLSASHTEKQVDDLLSAISDVLPKI